MTKERTDAPILIVYESRFGQTEKIARRIEERLREGGLPAECRDARRVPPDLDLGTARTVIIGGSVRFGRHAAPLRAFARRRVAERGARGGAFFSVCGAASVSTPEAVAEAEGYRARFLAQTGWTPALQASFGGAVAYTRYGWLTRWLIRRIQRSKGLDTDTSRDFEYTDWDAVDGFAEAVTGILDP